MYFTEIQDSKIVLALGGRPGEETFEELALRGQQGLVGQVSASLPVLDAHVNR